MVGNKIKYTCKNCGWTCSIREEWPDMKPKRCMNRRCNTNFDKNKEALQIDMPAQVEETKVEPVKHKKSKKSDEQ